MCRRGWLKFLNLNDYTLSLWMETEPELKVKTRKWRILAGRNDFTHTRYMYLPQHHNYTGTEIRISKWRHLLYTYAVCCIVLLYGSWSYTVIECSRSSTSKSSVSDKHFSCNTVVKTFYKALLLLVHSVVTRYKKRRENLRKNVYSKREGY